VRAAAPGVLVAALLASSGTPLLACCARQTPQAVADGAAPAASAAVATGSAVAAATGQGAAAAPPAREVPVEVVRGSAQCGGGAAPWVRWVADETAWRGAFPTTLLGAPAAPAPVDFARDGVLLVGMGQRPTGGFGIRLAAPVARVEGGVATVRVAFTSPPPGAMVTQALTSPCLAVRVPRAGLDEVRAVDAAGRLVGAARLR